LSGDDGGVNDGVEVVEATPLEGEFSKAGAVETSIWGDDIGAEGADDLGVDEVAGLHHLAAEGVGFNDVRAEFAEEGGDGAFAAAETAGESYAEHRLKASPHFGGANSVGHEHGDGEEANAAGNGGVGTGEFEGLGVDIADDDRAALGEGSFAFFVAGEVAVELFAGVDAIDANVDKGYAGLDHLRSDVAGAADGGDEDVGLARDLCEVFRFGMADGNSCILVQQEHGGGLADDVAAAHNDSMLAGDRKATALENFDDACGRAGREGWTAGLQAACIHRVEAVDVFGWIDGVEELFGVDLGGEGELDEDAVDFVAVVEGSDEVEHLAGGDGVGGRDEVGIDAELGAGLNFAADVNFRGGDVADKDSGEAGADTLGGEAADFFGDFLLDGGGNNGAVEDFRHANAPRIHRIASGRGRMV
jgi:hypothetical protein